MRILFVHQNFPGQFVHLAPALAQRGHEVLALTTDGNARPSPVPVARYKMEERTFDQKTFRLSKTFAEMTHRGEAVVLAAVELRDKLNFVPDIVFGHIGWGETMFVKEVWPETRHLLYAEFFYRPRGLDTGFDPETGAVDLGQSLWITARQGHALLAMNSADKALAPTRWQASTFPENLQKKITVVHDGIDTAAVAPASSVRLDLPGVPVPLCSGDEILTFINRNLEPYRGYHTFMRALPKVLQARKNARVIIIGGDKNSYGLKPKGGKSWKDVFLDEVKDRIDLSRVHFTGAVPYTTFVDLMRVTRVHAYLTVPFVLSWSMLEAMSAGALVAGSKTPPVEEVIEDGVNGLLVDFFDHDAWAETLISALAEPKRYDGLRTAARETILNRFDLRSVCLPQLIKFVEEA